MLVLVLGYFEIIEEAPKALAVEAKVGAPAEALNLCVVRPRQSIVAVKEQIKVTFPLILLATPANWQFAGYANRFAPSLPFNQKMVATIAAKVSGKITKTAEA